jgi:hypothetical protein
MTRKDYELIATVVRSVADKETRRLIAEAFARLLAQDNARFRPATFLAACGAQKEAQPS